MTDTTPEPRKGRLRRIVKRTAWTVVGIASLPVWYVLSFGVLWWYIGYDTGSVPNIGRDVAVKMQDTLYGPLSEYETTERPGAEFLRHFAGWCYANGLKDTYVSWEDSEIESFGGGQFGDDAHWEGGGFF